MSHARDFGLESGDDETARQIRLDYRTAALAPPQRALCDFAVRLTLDPGGRGPADLDVLRAHGFDDDAITIAVQVVAYFNGINRIADGLGVDPEPWMAESIDAATWHATRASDWDRDPGLVPA